jgi:hypothetical protein
MKISLFLICIFSIATTYGQAPQEADSIAALSQKEVKTEKRALPETVKISFSHTTPLPIDSLSFHMLSDKVVVPTAFSYRNFLPSPNSNKKIQFDHLNISSTWVATLATEDWSNGHKLNDQLSFFLQSSHLNYWAEGATTAGASLSWHPTKRFNLSINPSLSSYFFVPMQLSPIVSPAISGCLQYDITDWLSVKTYGEYTTNEGHALYSSLLCPQTTVGGAVVIKFSEHFGIETGVEYVCIMGKWRPQYYATPVFYKNR